VRDDRLYIDHVLECVRRIEEYCPDGEKAFRASELIQDAVLRNLTLFFPQGAGQPDPKHLLKGSGKVVRHIVLASAADLDSPAVQGLMATALKRAEPGIDPGVPGSLVIRSVSPKQRPRRPA
jgi:hypothetical protein